jgi:hypothetical protein
MPRASTPERLRIVFHKEDGEFIGRSDTAELLRVPNVGEYLAAPNDVELDGGFRVVSVIHYPRKGPVPPEAIVHVVQIEGDPSVHVKEELRRAFRERNEGH